ncbi:MAG TPA: TonB-dependent hemoglobin/transferrin/lactoferrin family receptor [Brevundimonas sp.]
MRAILLLTTAMTAIAGAAHAQSGPSDPVSEVEGVSVLATRNATQVDEAPATVSVITAAQIEANLYTDIKDLVRFEPGVSVVSQPARFGAALGTAGRAGNEGFTIRGLGGDRVLMVVDGVRTPDGFVFGAQSVGRGGYSDLELMKSVEILRGPASALYGSDGVAGAVAFTTRDPEDFLTGGRDVGLRLRTAYNSADNGFTNAFAVAGRLGGAFSGMLAYTRRDSSETETGGVINAENATRTTANPQTIESDAVLAKLVWDVNASNRLRLTWDYFDLGMTADVLSGRSGTVLQLLADDATTRERVSLDWRFSDQFGLDRGQVAVYSQDAMTRQFTFEDRTPAVDRTRDNSFDNSVWGFAADARKTLSLGGVEHAFTFGGDWSETNQQGVRDGAVPPFGETFPVRPFPETDYTLAGAFIQDEISLMGGRLRIIPAVRFDAYELSTRADHTYIGARADQEDDHISPKLGVVWWSNDTFGLFANYAEGFKAPTPSQVNNGFTNVASGYTSISNPNLRPETSESLEIGARVRDVPAFGGAFSAQAVVFQSNFDDFISQQQVSGSFTPADPAVYQFVNFAEVEISGAEFRSNIHWDNGFSARLSAAYADGEQTMGGVTRNLATIDPVKIVGGLGWDAPSGVFGGQAVVTWSAAKDSADTDGLGCYNANPAIGCLVGEDFALLDLTGYWHINDNVTARVGLFNVTDETYGWWSDIRGVAATSAARDAYTQPGRNIGVSLSLRL